MLVYVKKLFIVVLMLGFPFLEIYSSHRVDSLLRVLDRTVSRRTMYEMKKKTGINKLKLEKSKLQDITSIYHINNKIIFQYESFVCDSAESYIHENIQIAKQLNESDLLSESEIELAFIYSLSGLFVQAYGILTSVEYDRLSTVLKIKYCWTYIRYYENLIKYTADIKYDRQYNKEIVFFRDEVLGLLNKESEEYLKERAFKLQEAGNYTKALKILLSLFQNTEPETHAFAMAAMSLAKIYALEESKEKENYYMILAAITDTQLAVKENEALLSLATNLYKDGRTDRAHDYIKTALEDANFFNSRFKNSVIARVQPIIENTYLLKIEHQKQNLRLYAAIITTGVLVLIIALYFNYNQKRIILETRRKLLHKNEELVDLNKRLDESNITKEKYIGYFINQSSVNFDKLQRFKKDVYLKIKAGLTSELSKLSSSAFETEEVYTGFDSAFLELYPDFVEKFNLLLRPGKQFQLPKNQLNTELRIFALIRLGITDVSQIALQLRLSTQTIYNYKSKIKKSSIIEGDLFEEEVKKIGSLC